MLQNVTFFDKFLVMQPNPVELTKKAVKAALKEDWESAIILNNQILEVQPTNLDAKIRLGRAYLQLEQFSNASKCFKEVLQKDPINSIALKNYEFAKSKKVGTSNKNLTGIIKEPGTYTEILLPIENKRLKADVGDNLEIKVLKSKSAFSLSDKEFAILDGNNAINKRLLFAKENNIALKANIVCIKEDKVKIMIVAQNPIFKSEKQDVKPYVKIGSLASDDFAPEDSEDEDLSPAEQESEDNTDE